MVVELQGGWATKQSKESKFTGLPALDLDLISSSFFWGEYLSQKKRPVLSAFKQRFFGGGSCPNSPLGKYIFNIMRGFVRVRCGVVPRVEGQ
jgi:hypothetical protein